MFIKVGDRAGEKFHPLGAVAALSEVHSLVPSTYNGWLTTAHNSSSYLLLAFVDISYR